MARNRQRAKQRQAERRAQRLAERADAGAAKPDRDEAADGGPARGKRRGAEPAVTPEERAGDGAPETRVAPPEDVGRSDTVLDSPIAAPDEEEDLRDEEVGIEDEEAFDEEEYLEAEEAVEEQEDEDRISRRRARADARERVAAETAGRGRLAQFLVAVVAELRRVQWPERRALTSLTGIVLLFVVIAGVYLGVLDWIFQNLVNEILGIK
jgi:preprotein translocase subunit SecE